MNSSSHVVHISHYSYSPQQPLGTGSTGSVFKGSLNKDQSSIAVKVIKLAEINTITKSHLLGCEIDALLKMNHPNVVKVFQVLKDSEYYFIPMQYCENGTLRNYIKAKKKLPVSQALGLFVQILEGYVHITQKKFIHRDLKTQNVLLTDKMSPVIIDFGYCEKKQIQNQSLPYNVGSPAYMSPEAYNQSRYSQKSDVWALGVILHEMLTGDIPKISHKDPNRHFKELAFKKYALISEEIQDKLCKQILYRALTVNQNQRPNCQQLLLFLKNRKAEEIRPQKNSVEKFQFYHPPHIVPKKKQPHGKFNLSYQHNITQPSVHTDSHKNLNTTLPDKKNKGAEFTAIRKKVQNSGKNEPVKRVPENRQNIFVPVLKKNSGQIKISKSYSEFKVKTHRI